MKSHPSCVSLDHVWALSNEKREKKKKDRFRAKRTGSSELRNSRKGNIFQTGNFKLLLLLLSFDFNWNFSFEKRIAFFLFREPNPFCFSVHCFSWKFQVFKLLVYVWEVEWVVGWGEMVMVFLRELVSKLSSFQWRDLTSINSFSYDSQPIWCVVKLYICWESYQVQ